MKFIKYKHIIHKMDNFNLTFDFDILIVKVTTFENVGKVKYKLGYGIMNNQDISIEEKNIIKRYPRVASFEEFMEKYPEAII